MSRPDAKSRILSSPGAKENSPDERNNWTYLEKESKRAIEAAGSSPAILAWALCDEPRRDLVGEMETFRRKFIEWGGGRHHVA